MMEIRVAGVTLIGWEFRRRNCSLQALFLTVAWQDGVFYLALGGNPLTVYVSSAGVFSLCLGGPLKQREAGARTEGLTTLVLLLGMLLVGQLRWWSVLAGLGLWWAAEYTLSKE